MTASNGVDVVANLRLKPGTTAVRSKDWPVTGLRTNHPSTNPPKANSVLVDLPISFHRDGAREENVVFQMNVLVEVSFKALQRFVQRAIADAGIRRKVIVAVIERRDLRASPAVTRGSLGYFFGP